MGITVAVIAGSADTAPQNAAFTGFVTVADGCRTHYARRGETGAAAGGGDAPVVALIHGSDGFLRDFDAVLQSWDRDGSGLPVVAFDRPGHGLSDAPSKDGGALPVQVALLRDALQQLYDSHRPVILVGHSWGAALALSWAVAYPDEVAGLVLLSPWAAPGVDPPSFLLRSARRIGPRVSHFLMAVTPLKGALLRWHLREAWRPDPVPRAFERQAAEIWQRTTAQIAVFLQENADTWARLPEIANGCAGITVPVAVVTGGLDRVLHADRQAAHLARVLPHAVFLVAPDVGHETPHLRPHLVWDAVRTVRHGSRRRAAAPPAGGTAKREPSARTPEMEHARFLALRYGWNVTAYQILNPDISLWFSDDGDAVVGYVERFHLRVAAGGPVCDPARLAEIVEAFERDACARGLGVCWFAVTPRLQNVLADANPARPRAVFTVGAQPAWDPRRWPERAQSARSLRTQLNRARNKNVRVSEWPVARAQTDTGLRKCRDEWLAHHSLPSLRFLTEPVALDNLGDRRIFVAETGDLSNADAATVVGFLLAAPVPTRRGWLVEQITRTENAPNGTAELLVDTAFRAFGTENFEYVTLGLVPLSRRAVIGVGENSPPLSTEAASAFTTFSVAPVVAAPPTRPWLRAALSWIRLHGRRFYNFEGLDAFKSKFKPEMWEPILVVFDTERVPARALLAIAAAFTEGPLPVTLARAALSAVREETRLLRRRLAS